MRKLIAPLLLIGLGMFIVACGPASDESSDGRAGKTETTGNGDKTVGEGSSDTRDETSGDATGGNNGRAAAQGTVDGSAAADNTANETGSGASEAAEKEPLEAPDENTNLDLDSPAKQ